ncbi:hypothetical protein Pan97_46080 [Bremerella volcania]|uniref:Carboxypeptidase regulatory-like domain-containing protein n=1 Tax=Bremerella volcania TaxID=2527984 RepID=A0A518CE90_9BACT|nr:hypothetical protein [Bremerella volcania]QDU77537.1 hypothetical protein Pan97_46080 [Bremerella volcania]
MSQPYWFSTILRASGVALLAFVVAGCDVTPVPQTARGKVLINGQARGGIEVTFWDAMNHESMLVSTTTSDDGTFLVQNIPLGGMKECVVTFSKPALKNGQDLPVDMKASEGNTVELVPKDLRDPNQSTVRATLPTNEFQYDITTTK